MQCLSAISATLRFYNLSGTWLRFIGIQPPCKQWQRPLFSIALLSSGNHPRILSRFILWSTHTLFEGIGCRFHDSSGNYSHRTSSGKDGFLYRNQRDPLIWIIGSSSLELVRGLCHNFHITEPIRFLVVVLISRHSFSFQGLFLKISHQWFSTFFGERNPNETFQRLEEPLYIYSIVKSLSITFNSQVFQKYLS